MIIGKYNYILGIHIIWSNNKLLPKAIYIYKHSLNETYSIGNNNEYLDYTYRFYPIIKRIKI